MRRFHNGDSTTTMSYLWQTLRLGTKHSQSLAARLGHNVFAATAGGIPQSAVRNSVNFFWTQPCQFLHFPFPFPSFLLPSALHHLLSTLPFDHTLSNPLCPSNSLKHRQYGRHAFRLCPKLRAPRPLHPLNISNRPHRRKRLPQILCPPLLPQTQRPRCARANE